MTSYSVIKEYQGLNPHPVIQVPSLSELMQLCPESHQQVAHLVHPPDNPIFWIKFGDGILWSEVEAQIVAQRELCRLNSTTQAPRIFHAYELGTTEKFDGKDHYVHINSFIVMEYMPGKTAKACISEGILGKETVCRLIADAVTELNRIPVPPNTPPSAVNGDRIRHTIFGDNEEAPRRYEDTQQLENHLNLFLECTKRSIRFTKLSQEPLIFCYSDIYLGNFIINEKRQVSVVDFADVSYLPSSFQRFDLLGTGEKLGYNISPLVDVPAISGVDNTNALIEVFPFMVTSFSSFVTIGRRL